MTSEKVLAASPAHLMYQHTLRAKGSASFKQESDILWDAHKAMLDRIGGADTGRSDVCDISCMTAINVSLSLMHGEDPSEDLVERSFNWARSLFPDYRFDCDQDDGNVKSAEADLSHRKFQMMTRRQMVETINSELESLSSRFDSEAEILASKILDLENGSEQ